MQIDKSHPIHPRKEDKGKKVRQELQIVHSMSVFVPKLSLCLVQVKPPPPPVEKKCGPAAKEARRKEKEERERNRVLEKQRAEEDARCAPPPPVTMLRFGIVPYM